MNFIDYVFETTKKYVNDTNLVDNRKQALNTLHNLNYKASCLKTVLKQRAEKLEKDMIEGSAQGQYWIPANDLLKELLAFDTELDEGYFDRTFIDPNKECGK